VLERVYGSYVSARTCLGSYIRMAARPGSSANFTSETSNALYRENRNLMDDWPKFTYSAVNGRVNYKIPQRKSQE
jgi:hypothetical protein